MAGLWRGITPNVARNAIVNAAELASFDQVQCLPLLFLASWNLASLSDACGIMQIKQSLLKTGIFEDNIYCHLLSGLGAGFFAVVFGSPVDVVKSRLMGQASTPPP